MSMADYWVARERRAERRAKLWKRAAKAFYERAQAAQLWSAAGDRLLRDRTSERDAYRQQATAFAEALVELGRQDIVDAAIEAAGERQG